MNLGSDTLTSYLLAIANEAGWQIPEAPKERMLSGLQGFAEGRVTRYEPLAPELVRGLESHAATAH